MTEIILPGTYIKVLDEGLISAGAISSGNIGIVGTASKGPIDEVVILGSFGEAKEMFGEADQWQDGTKNELTLIRALELIYNNGGKTIYAVRTADKSKNASANASLNLKSGSTTAIEIVAESAGTWGNGILVTVTEADSQRQVSILSGVNKETYLGASTPDLVANISKNSQLVTATQKSAGDLNNLAETPLTGGKNGENVSSIEYQSSLEKLENDIVNIVILAGQDTEMASILDGHLNVTKEIKRERIGIIGGISDDVSRLASHGVASDRMILVGPGLVKMVVDPETRKKSKIDLPAGYMAAVVAGKISSLPVQASPTNKTLTVEGLSTVYTSSKLEKLVQGRVLTVENREGFRIVKGITTATNSAWHQITTRRIVDYAIYGVRSSCNSYIGKLNNERVRGALKATIDGFLTRMVNNEALVGYELEVSATRAQQIAGEVVVNMTLQPVFSIDFIKVNMYLS